MTNVRSPALVLLATAFVACSGDTVTDPATTVARVTVNAGRTSLAVGSALQLSADAANAAGTILVDRTITWVSSRPEVATITSLGLVRGLSVGSTVITATCGGRSGTLALTVQAPNKIVLTSDAGDYIGGGARYSYTNANALIGLTANTTTVQLSILGDQRWDAAFQVQIGGQLALGSYAATRFPFQGSGAGMSWYGEGRGCNMLTGSFTIDSLSWDGTGSKLLGIDMHFEQHCEGGAAALHGTIHWRSDDPTVPLGPVLPIPTGLWQPPAGATPAAGNFVYLQSDPGEYVGGGSIALYQTNISIGTNSNTVTITAGGYTGVFQGMNTISQLQVGYYGGLLRWPFNNPTLGGLSWFGNGRGCNTLTGWFVVDRVSYASGVIASIELRFEQHCDGQSPALHGVVRWG